MQKPDTVFFDLDGTLADSLDALRQVYFDFLTTHHRTGSTEEFAELNGPSLREIVRTIKLRYELTPSESELFQQYQQLLAVAYERAVRPFGDASELLVQLKDCDITLGLVTSSPATLVEPFLRANSWQEIFAIVVTGDTVVSAKPSPEIYLKALSVARVPAKDSIAIEDSLNGVRAAHSAGLTVIGICPADDGVLRAAGALSTVRCLHEIPRLILANST
ncbi:MAG TPA: HAD family phosphatase [Oculatellaceae cyanobacterium]